MGKKNKKQNKNEVEEPEQNIAQAETEEQESEVQVEADEQEVEAQVEAEDPEQEVEVTAEPTPEETIELLQAELEKGKNDYLLLLAEFDNYRKRTLQEKQDLIKNGGQKVLEGILPVVDDIERAIDAIAQGGDLDSLKEGVDLIHNKLLSYLKVNNVEPIESTGELFDTDFHEAVTTFPAPSEDQKGKVIDTVLKGYTLNDKVLRHAKVVVGQ
ncbi:MAG: nucleotide exchange factor GrpE [Muribaculaceae bacterium]|nr:nucleotide exchange factor GrpE [Muribaculaceae bacterium]